MSCFTCIWKKPYSRTEPWTCPGCGVVHALWIEPAKFVTKGHRERAIEILDILSSQDVWEYGVYTLPGYGRTESRERHLADAALRHNDSRSWDFAHWREAYASGAMLLRQGYLAGATTTSSLNDILRSEMVRDVMEEWA